MPLLRALIVQLGEGAEGSHDAQQDIPCKGGVVCRARSGESEQHLHRHFITGSLGRRCYSKAVMPHDDRHLQVVL